MVLRSQEKEVLKVIENPLAANCKLTHGKWCEDEDDWGIPSRCVIFLSLDPMSSRDGH